MKKLRTTVSVIIMILAGIAGFFAGSAVTDGMGGAILFRLHSLYGGQPRLIIVGRVKRYY